jgi:hypothetical protein
MDIEITTQPYRKVLKVQDHKDFAIELPENVTCEFLGNDGCQDVILVYTESRPTHMQVERMLERCSIRIENLKL